VPPLLLLLLLPMLLLIAPLPLQCLTSHLPIMNIALNGLQSYFAVLLNYIHLRHGSLSTVTLALKLLHLHPWTQSMIPFNRILLLISFQTSLLS
jgi:hypothetical protein